ncbi:cytochrome P450 [Ascodesmis nigricans]|uniref:Cytochrome P450 n=1 Tax=Ascodesmis nigricans TaxID=341454 RepID=A0A4S2MIE9_9PEZI|nr:cytochrome P450 [Ascodesmis nigricans]
MLSELLGISGVWHLKIHASTASPSIAGLMTLLAIIAAWIVHFFNISRRRQQKSYDQEPPTLPYWIPWLGHAVHFLRNSNGIIDRAIAYFGNNRPFTIYAGGERLYILTNPKDVRQLYRKTRQLSFSPFVETIVLNVYHFDEHDFKTLTAVHPVTGATILGETHGFYRHHLLPGERLNTLKARYIQELEHSMENITFPSEGVNLFPWVCDTIGSTSTSSVFGRGLLERNPGLLKDLWVFDELHLWMISGMPRYFTQPGFDARDRLLTAVEEYFDQGYAKKEERLDMVWMREEMISKTGLSRRARAALHLTIYWAMQTNSVRAAYWTLSYILRTPSLLNKIRAEIAPAFSTSSPTKLINPDLIITDCPLFNATFNEALRLTSGSASSRVVAEDTEVGGYILKVGGKVMAPSIQPHMDASMWGDDVEEFRPERFLNKDGQWDGEVERKMGYGFRPFGGGETFCPGRHFARFQDLTFVASVIHRWEARVPEKTTWPTELRNRSAIGVLDPSHIGPRVNFESRLNPEPSS